MSLLARLLSPPSEAPEPIEDEWIEPVAAGQDHLWSVSGTRMRTEIPTDLARPVTAAMPTFLAGERCGVCGGDLDQRTAFYTEAEQWLCGDCFRKTRAIERG